jgi:hypothetical protein
VLVNTTTTADEVSFAPAVDLPVRDDPAGSDPRSLVLLDLDEDGDLDIAVVANNVHDQAVARVLRNDLSGGQLAFAPATDLDAGTDPVMITAGDLNGDGKKDLIALGGSMARDGKGSGSVVIRLNHPNGPVAGDIDGDSQVDLTDVAIFVDVLLGADTDPAHVAASDLNSSGAADGVDIEPFVNALLGQAYSRISLTT